MEKTICKNCHVEMKFIKKEFEYYEDSSDIDEWTDGQQADYFGSKMAGLQSEETGTWNDVYECPKCHNLLLKI